MESGKAVKTIVLRVLALVCFLVAAIVMFLSHQKVSSSASYPYSANVYLIAKYVDWDAFLLCAVVDCIGCAYNLIVLIIPAGSQLWKTVVVLDVIVNILVGASLGVGWQTYSLIKEGNMVARWCPICGIFPFFCSKILGSLITSTFGFFISILLLMYILHVTLDPFLVGDH